MSTTILHLGRDEKIPVTLTLARASEDFVTVDVILPPEFSGISPQTISIKIGDTTYSLPLSQSIKIPYGAMPEKLEGSFIIHSLEDGQPRIINNFFLAKQADEVVVTSEKVAPTTLLTTLDVRNIALRGGLPRERHASPDYIPRTDLHTHWTAILPGDQILDVALERYKQPLSFYYPTFLLQKLGIKVDKYEQVRSDKFPEQSNTPADLEGSLHPLPSQSKQDNFDRDLPANSRTYIDLNTLDSADLQLLRNALSLPKDTSVLFADQARRYLVKIFGLLSKNPLANATTI